MGRGSGAGEITSSNDEEMTSSKVVPLTAVQWEHRPTQNHQARLFDNLRDTQEGHPVLDNAVNVESFSETVLPL